MSQNIGQSKGEAIKVQKSQQSKSLRQIDISPGRTTVALLFIRGGLGHIIPRQKKRL